MRTSFSRHISHTSIRTFIISLTVAFTATFISSCVHEFPDTAESGSVRLTIVHDLSWSELDYDYARSGDDSRREEWSVRYIIKAYKHGDTSIPVHEFVRFSDDLDLDPFITGIELPPGDWDLYIWSDFIHGKESYYEATEFSEITYTRPYTGDTDRRDAFEGMAEKVTVEESYDASYRVDRTVTLHRPTARYVFIATDFRKFYNETLRPSLEPKSLQAPAWGSLPAPQRNELLKGYSVTASYPLFMPSVYDMFRQKVTASERGVTYGASITPIDDDEARIAFDYVFMNHHSTSAQVQLILHTPGGDNIIMTPTVSVPLKRGQTTYVRGKFLTTDIGGGIDIDFDFSGDINIEI